MDRKDHLLTFEEQDALGKSELLDRVHIVFGNKKL